MKKSYFWILSNTFVMVSKRTFLWVALVILIVGGLGSVVYAQIGHDPPTSGKKLVGVAQLGKTISGNTEVHF